MTTTPEREALAALAHRIESARGEAPLLIDPAAAAAIRSVLAASPAAGGVQALTDEQIDDCLPLGMHAHSVLYGPDEIRRFARRIETRLLAATPPAAPAQAQADALDARRYRWLRTSTDSKSDGARSEMVGLYADDFLDAAIDAALASQEGAAK